MQFSKPLAPALAVFALGALLGAGEAATPPCGSGQRESRTSGAAADIVLSIRVGKTQFRELEPIVVEYRLVNRSKQLGLTFISAHPSCLVVDLHVISQGFEMPATRYFESKTRRVLAGTDGLSPGGTYSGRLIANLIRDMTADGNYVMEARMELTVTADNGKSFQARTVVSNPVTVTVKGDPVVEKP